MTLSKNEEDILCKIVGYGGYVTKEMLALYRTDLSIDRCYRILTQLERKRYIKEREYFESFKQPTVYQVTKKACRYFDRAEAYMRKVHKPYAMRRYLIRAHFLFYLAGQGKPITLFSSTSRQKFLNDKGFTDYYLPKKYNKNIETVQIEEFIIDVEPYSKKHTICFLYVDNQNYSIDRQIKHLLSKYDKMQKSKKGFIDILIVTENEIRAINFRKIYEENYSKHISMIGLKSYSINRVYKSII